MATCGKCRKNGTPPEQSCQTVAQVKAHYCEVYRGFTPVVKAPAKAE